MRTKFSNLSDHELARLYPAIRSDDLADYAYELAQRLERYHDCLVTRRPNDQKAIPRKTE